MPLFFLNRLYPTTIPNGANRNIEFAKPADNGASPTAMHSPMIGIVGAGVDVAITNKVGVGKGVAVEVGDAVDVGVKVDVGVGLGTGVLVGVAVGV